MLKTLFLFLFLFCGFPFHVNAQEDTVFNDTSLNINLINLDLVGVNTSLPRKKLIKIERFFEKGGFRIFISKLDKIRISKLELPNIHFQNELNYLQKKLISKYRIKNNIQKSHYTVFIFKKNDLNIPFSVNAKLGVIFLNQSNLEDNLIQSLGKIFQVEIDKKWIDSTYLQDSIALSKIRLFKPQKHLSLHKLDRFFSTGLVNYCSWEENEYGSVFWDFKNPLSAIKTHKKENIAITYLDPSNWFFKPILILFNIKLCPSHFIVLFTTILILTIVYWRIGKELKSRHILSLAYKYLLRLFAVVFFILFTGFSFYLIDSYYQNHYVKETELVEISGDLCAEDVLRTIHNDLNFSEDSVQVFENQILKKRDGSWFIQREKPILIFRINHQNKMNFIESKYTYKKDNRKFIGSKYNHYYVFEKVDENDEILWSKIYSTTEQKEIRLDEKIKTKNRILLFVNGYRAMYRTEDEVSRSGIIKLIAENKPENPNSKNKIYSNNIYDLYAPWHAVKNQFIHKIQPKHIFYADGHHSIKTSNYNITKFPFYINYFNKMGNLGYFGFVCLNYPERCKDLKNHTCKYVNIPKIGSKKTAKLLPKKSNKNGFKIRNKSGQIAGKNLLQLINNEKYDAKNDTIFIVCHSMGFAYASGIIDELKNKINFGGLYIIAPENPEGGTVNPKEWKEVWHYGCDENIEECLRDGIAPQGPINGLENKRVLIPEKMNARLGFSASHYLSRYKWIFDLKPYEKGYVSNH